jgi:hypothetical protein
MGNEEEAETVNRNYTHAISKITSGVFYYFFFIWWGGT